MDAYIMHQECIFSWLKPLMQQKPPSLSPSSFMFIFPINSKKKKEKKYLPIFVPTLQTHPLVHPWWHHRDLTEALCRSCRGFAKSCQLCFAAGSQTEAKILIVSGGSFCKSELSSLGCPMMHLNVAFFSLVLPSFRFYRNQYVEESHWSAYLFFYLAICHFICVCLPACF